MQVLIVDDSADDALLLAYEIRRAGYHAIFEWVASEDQLRQALNPPAWDLVLCDYSMPRLDADSVLRICRAMRVTAPVIIVSGVVGEYVAAKLIAAGAREYLSKCELAKLASVVRAAAGPAAGGAVEPRRGACRHHSVSDQRR